VFNVEECIVLTKIRFLLLGTQVLPIGWFIRHFWGAGQKDSFGGGLRRARLPPRFFLPEKGKKEPGPLHPWRKILQSSE